MDILDFLRADGSIVVNKKLAHEIGLNEAVVYSELVSLYKYWSEREELTEDGFFYCTYENIERNTTLKEKAALRAINKLVKLELIEKVSRGLPRKNYYKITPGIYRLMSDWSQDGNKYKETTKDLPNGGTDNDSSSTVNKSSNNRQIQNLQNGGSNTDEIDVKEHPKRPLNNTELNNNKLNNTEIVNKQVDNSSFEYQDTSDIEKEYLQEGLSPDVIQRVKEEIANKQEPVRHYEAYLRTCLDNTLHKHRLKRDMIDQPYPHLPANHPLNYNWLQDN